MIILPYSLKYLAIRMAERPESGTSRSSIHVIKRDLKLFMEGNANRREQRSNCTIFKVGAREREMRPQCFQHEVISLGLYDRSSSASSPPNPKGDAFRLEIVGTILEVLGMTVHDWDKICCEVVQDPDKMRHLYDDVGSDLEVEVVRSELTLDALFLACCLGTWYNEHFESMFQPLSNIFKMKGSTFRNMLFMDILKLENQIPLSLIRSALKFMIVQKVQSSNVNRISRGSDVTISSDIEMNRVEERHGDELKPGDEIRPEKYKVSEVLQSICQGFPAHHSSNLPFKMSWFYGQPIYGEIECEGSKHLLDHLYAGTRDVLLKLNEDLNLDRLAGCGVSNFLGQLKKCAGNAAKMIWSKCPKRKYLDRMRSRCWPIWEYLLCNPQVLKSYKSLVRNPSQSLPLALPVPSATKLHEFGIQCCGRVGQGVEFKVSLFKATLFLPVINNIGSDSEPLWRNMVAYEDGKYGSPQILKSYLHFMDALISTEKDVVLLTTGKHPVIAGNGLGSEKAVAQLFNSMLPNYNMYNTIISDKRKSDYKMNWEGLTQQVHAYCNNKPRQKLVEFRRTYLTKPWLIISILFAGLLLVLTFLQTLYTILSYVHRKEK